VLGQGDNGLRGAGSIGSVDSVSKVKSLLNAQTSIEGGRLVEEVVGCPSVGCLLGKVCGTRRRQVQCLMQKG